ncbi:helix-turn-helix domain-containing protein [Arthrobacter sp. NA-172]|uniref:helix-turn-helix domain-containing protein n=1 Tax=Arthrobacter sp. NA-172 TaxID=3367524 RepID=UPI0037544A0D
MSTTTTMTTREAAERLGITQQSVRQLINNGQLKVEGTAGRAKLLSRSSVERLAAAGTRRGRPWTAKVAWAALALLSGRNPNWISSSEKSRLKSRLNEMDADTVRILARNKDRTLRFRVSPDGIAILIDHLIVSGAAAMQDQDMAETFGMSGGGGIAEGYVMAGDAQALADALGMVQDPDGNAIIHEVDFNPFEEGKAPVAAIAVDLMDSLATRERSAGRRVIDGLLHA